MENEIYKSITGYEGLYWVSNLGNVKTQNWKNTGRESILKPAKDYKGYLKVALMKGGKLKSYRVHRLVAKEFNINPDNKNQVNHINGIKSDNRSINLEWCNNSENLIHAHKLGLIKSKKGCKRNNVFWMIGENNSFAKLNSEQIKEIRQKFNPRIYTRQMLANEYNVKESCIKDIITYKSWKHIK